MEDYPFLIKRNDSETPDSWYSAWDNTGWEKIWKDFCGKIKTWYDSLSDDAKEKFYFLDVKEKYGQLRTDPSFIPHKDKDLSFTSELAEISGFTCYKCGNQPVDENGNHYIYFSRGYTLPFCKECAENEMAVNCHLKSEFDKYFDRDSLENNIFHWTFYKGDSRTDAKYLWRADGLELLSKEEKEN